MKLSSSSLKIFEIQPSALAPSSILPVVLYLWATSDSNRIYNELLVSYTLICKLQCVCHHQVVTFEDYYIQGLSRLVVYLY